MKNTNSNRLHFIVSQKKLAALYVTTLSHVSFVWVEYIWFNVQDFKQ